MTLRINMWSSPRNLSTAMMYSWRQRSDTTVVDEPLYAHYLHTTGRVHPGNEDVLASQAVDGQRVIDDVLLGQYDTPVVFFKQMAKHLVALDRDVLTSGPNILLTREPADMLSSLQVQLPDVTMADTGFGDLLSILDTIVANGGEPIVLDSMILLKDPRRVLEQLCQRLGLAFEEAMLSWPAGPKPEDGVWAPHWYDRVWESTHWSPYVPKKVELNAAAQGILGESRSAYSQLAEYAIQL